MKVIDQYLKKLQERQWDEPTDRPEAFNMNMYKQIIGQLAGNKEISRIRHAHQPSLYSIYIKNVLGDYKGRPHGLNVRRFRNIGIQQFEKR